MSRKIEKKFAICAKNFIWCAFSHNNRESLLCCVFENSLYVVTFRYLNMEDSMEIVEWKEQYNCILFYHFLEVSSHPWHLYILLPFKNIISMLVI